MSRSIFDLLAPIYGPISRVIFTNTWKNIIKRMDLKSGDKILDIGGGQGQFLDEIQKEVKDIDVYLLDGSKSMVKKASLSNRILGKACSLPLAEDSFDHILCIDALHHFQNQKESKKEMIRTLKPGGDIHILDLDKNEILTKIVCTFEFLVGEPSRFYEGEELKKYFSERGFQTSIERLNSYEFILQVKKDHSE